MSCLHSDCQLHHGGEEGKLDCPHVNHAKCLLSTAPSLRNSARILVTGGRQVDPRNLLREDCTPEIMAHMLAKQDRFAGAGPEHYSVAEHVCIASDYGKDIYEKRHLFAHDWHEYLYQDLIPPNKRMMSPAYRRECAYLDSRLFGYHNVSRTLDSDALVERVDDHLAAMEMNQFFGLGLPTVEGLPIRRIQCWDWRTAKENFLVTYKSLFGSYQ